MNSERIHRILPVLVLALVGWAMRPLESRLGASVSAPAPTLAGGGGVLGVLGGFRAVVAGVFWLKTNLAWERQDAAGTRALLELTVAADDRPLYFWLNGARMMAHDFPMWGEEGRPLALLRQERARHAAVAERFLEQALVRRGRSPEILIEMANIRLRSLGDKEGAARLFREAAELPGAPHYAARIHAELLRELGRPAEALAWLRHTLPALPADDPAAQRAIVERRIKELEAMLQER